MLKNSTSAPLLPNGLLGADLDWCFSFESKVETLRILNIIPESSLTDKGRKSKVDLQKWIDENTDKYLTLTGR